MTSKLLLNSFLILFIFSTISAQKADAFQSKFSVNQLKNAPAKLIPFPQKFTWKKGFLEVSQVAIVFEENVKQYSNSLSEELNKILSENKIDISSGSSLKITFKGDKKIVREGYHIKVIKKGILISASSETGYYYALQTLRQLFDTTDKIAQIPLCEISDWPQHEFRGYMIDVGRNYQSMALLKKQLDIMAMYKLNKFHWHLTDRPAWRIESKKYPQLNYANNHRQTRDPGKYYTYDEIRELIQYAKERHITVIPEIDMPGHSDSFRVAMGVKMESKEGMIILENVLNEFFAEIPKEDCPIIHIGSDEVHIPNPDKFIEKMVKICKDNDREVIIWNPGLKGDDSVIRQTWQDKGLAKGKYKEIDSWNNYINGAEPMMQILRLFFRPIGFPSENNIIGGTVCFWPDVNLRHESEAFEQNPVYPSMLTYAWTTWTADLEKGTPEYYVTMPPKNTRAYSYFSEFENILLYHKEKYFSEEPFPYFRQSDKEWKIIGPFDGDDGDEILNEIKDSYSYKNSKLSWETVVGNTMVLRERWVKNGHFSEAKVGQSVYALTYIHSDTDQEIEAMIGFETALRANKIYTGIPEIGSWDPSGGNIWVNDKPVSPPKWNNAGWKPSKQDGWGSKADQEIPWEKQDFYWTRQPSKIQLKKGWNKIFVKIPLGTEYQNWMFTFIPLNMEDLKFSTEK